MFFFYVNKTLSGRLRELKNKGKVQLDNPKSGQGRLWKWSLMEAVAYDSISLQSLSHSSNRVSQRW